MDLRFINIVYALVVLPLKCWAKFHYMDIPWFLHPFIHWYSLVSIFFTMLNIVAMNIFVFTYIFLLRRFLRVEMLSHMISIHWPCYKRSTKLLSEVVLSFQIPANNIAKFQLFHLLVNAWVVSLLTFSHHVVYLIIVLFFISLMANDVRNLFVCFLAISLSSFEKFLFKYLAQLTSYWIRRVLHIFWI